MVDVLKSVFFLVILQLTLASAIKIAPSESESNSVVVDDVGGDEPIKSAPSQSNSVVVDDVGGDERKTYVLDSTLMAVPAVRGTVPDPSDPTGEQVIEQTMAILATPSVWWDQVGTNVLAKVNGVVMRVYGSSGEHKYVFNGLAFSKLFEGLVNEIQIISYDTMDDLPLEWKEAAEKLPMGDVGFETNSVVTYQVYVR